MTSKDTASRDSCPDKNVLRAWAVGNVTDAQSDQIVDHLGSCSQCEEFANGVSLIDFENVDLNRIDWLGDSGCDEVLSRLITQKPSEQKTGSMAATTTHDTLSGKQVRDYALTRKIGQGGMGAVYLAHHARLDRPVAIKVLGRKFADDPDVVDRFKREIQIVGQMNHPHIVSAFDAGEMDGLHFLVMEYIDGPDLSKLTKGGLRLPVDISCLLVKQIAMALDYAHAQGCIHRDVKPSNIMLSADFDGVVRAKLLDLGLAFWSDSRVPELELNSDSQLVGTLEYMSPEQACSSEAVNHLSDLYSLGATLYRLLTGTIPFRADEYRGPASRLYALAHSDPPSIATRREDLPAELVNLVDRMVSLRQQDRPESMKVVIDELSEFCGPQLHRIPRPLPALEIPARVEDQAEPSASVSESVAKAGMRDTSPQVGETVIIKAGRLVGSRKKSATRSFKMWAVLALVAVSACAIIWLKTNGGWVRVETTDDVQLSVRQVGAEQSESIEVKRGDKRFWLGVGNYELTLASDHRDELKLSHQALTVSRGSEMMLSVDFHENRDDAPEEESSAALTVSFNELGWMWSAPQNLGAKVNSEWKDDQATVSSDGLTVIFGSYCIPRFAGEGDRDLWVSTRESHSESWGPAVNLSSMINSPMKEMGPTINDVSSTLVFASNRVGGRGGSDLWYSIRNEDDSWERPINLGPNANSEFDDTHPEISSDGRTLLFTSKRPSSKQNYNLWMCRRESPQHRWGVPKEILTINSDSNETAAALSDDGLVLVFASDRPGGLGGMDLWGSTRINDRAPWAKPFNLGHQINTKFRENHPAFVPGTRQLIFASDREPGLGEMDLYETELLEKPASYRVLELSSKPNGEVPPVAVTPFTEVRAKELQKQWAAHYGIPIEYSNSLGMPMRLIPPGEFVMGPGQEEHAKAMITRQETRPSRMDLAAEGRLVESEWPPRQVKLTQPFYIGKFEVNEAEFAALIGLHAGFKSRGDDFPAGMANWFRAARFCNHLNHLESFPLRYEIDGKNVSILPQTHGYRLPSEAQWEFACRAGSQAAYPFGDDPALLNDYARAYQGDAKAPAIAIGQKKPNAFGLYDMLGNHWEWCEDADTPRDLKSPWTDPMFDGDSRHRMARGGFALSIPEDLRVARRRRHLADMVYPQGGFRIILVLPAPESEVGD